MDNFCSRAMPYIKADLNYEREGASPPDVTCPHDDPNAPILLDLKNGLLVAYLVDTGKQFEYVQNRHLTQAALSADELHSRAMSNLWAFMGERTQMRPYGNIYGLFLDG